MKIKVCPAGLKIVWLHLHNCFALTKKQKFRPKVFTISEDFKVHISNSRTRAEEKARATIGECRSFGSQMKDESASSLSDQLDNIAECMRDSIQTSFADQQDEIEFQASTRRRLGSRLKHYACSDPLFPTTQPLAEQEWTPNNPRLKMDDDDHTVRILFQTDTTMIATIDNLARPVDCDFVRERSELTEEGPPKAVPWDVRKDPAALSFLSRVYAYVDPAVKMMSLYARLPQKGEALFKLYEDSSELPHPPHLHPNGEWPVEGVHFGRLLMFCEVPEEGGGGAVHFPESGVHVHPQVGQGLLVTYSKPTQDQGFLETLTNEHFDCPILAGKRTIVQHQFRLYHHVVGF